MEKDKSKMWFWVIGVIVVVGILFFIFNKKVVSPVTIPSTETTTTTTTTTEPVSVQDVDQTTGAGAASISYANALVKYADRRIQLDKSCQAHPNTATYKDNTGIMIDNRSPNTRTVKVGYTFTIKPYGFKIVVLPDIYLKSKTLLVDCDKSQNVATVLVQE